MLVVVVCVWWWWRVWWWNMLWFLSRLLLRWCVMMCGGVVDVCCCVICVWDVWGCLCIDCCCWWLRVVCLCVWFGCVGVDVVCWEANARRGEIFKGKSFIDLCNDELIIMYKFLVFILEVISVWCWCLFGWGDVLLEYFEWIGEYGVVFVIGCVFANGDRFVWVVFIELRVCGEDEFYEKWRGLFRMRFVFGVILVVNYEWMVVDFVNFYA